MCKERWWYKGKNHKKTHYQRLIHSDVSSCNICPSLFHCLSKDLKELSKPLFDFPNTFVLSQKRNELETI